MGIVYFLAGIFFCNIVYPLIEKIVDVLLTILESKKAKYGLAITKLNYEIKQVNNNDEESDDKPTIGFGASH